jgi:hypothetical protein
MTTFAQYIKNGVFTRQAEQGCDMFSHHELDGLSSLRHRKMLHAKKGTKTLPVLRVFGPLYPAKKVKSC